MPTPARAYLAHAAVGLLHPDVVAAATAVLHEQATLGVAAVGVWLPRLDQTRGALAALLGVPADEVALTRSTTDGVTAIARGLPWQRGDGVVLLRGEFPANVLPWLAAAEREGLTVHWLDAADFHGADATGLTRLADVLRHHRIRLVAVSAVQFQTGLRLPLDALGQLAHTHGAELFVDGIQAVGAVPLSLTHVDYLAAGGHKWLAGPSGTGLLWARAHRWAALRPALGGWLSVEDPVRFLFGAPGLLRYDKPTRAGHASVEGSAQNFVGWCALGEAVRLVARVGPAATLAHVSPQLDAAETALVDVGFTSTRSPVREQQSTILGLRPPAHVDLGALAHAAADAGIVVSTPDGHLRIAPSWSTPPAATAWATSWLSAQASITRR